MYIRNFYMFAKIYSSIDVCIRCTECDVMYTLYVMSGPKEASSDGPAIDAVNILWVCHRLPTYYATAHAQINYQACKLDQDMA